MTPTTRLAPTILTMSIACGISARRTAQVIPATRAERVLLALILLIGAGLRLWLLLGPFAEIDADEAVVGLMALQVPGEIPAFYWQQQYLGTIAPLGAAGVFAVVEPS